MHVQKILNENDNDNEDKHKLCGLKKSSSSKQWFVTTSFSVFDCMHTINSGEICWLPAIVCVLCLFYTKNLNAYYARCVSSRILQNHYLFDWLWNSLKILWHLQWKFAENLANLSKTVQNECEAAAALVSFVYI